MIDRSLELIFTLGLLGIAGTLVVILFQIWIYRQNRRILERVNPEFPDLTPLFIDLQERISSEAEETRAEAMSHAKNTQTAVKALTGVVKKVQTRQDLTMANINTGFTETHKQVEKASNDLYTDLTAEAQTGFVDTLDTIRDEHKKTRKDLQEVKTRLTWSRKREKADLADDEAEVRRQAELMGLIEKLENDPLGIESDPTLPEGAMVLRDEKTSDEATISGITPDDLIVAAQEAQIMAPDLRGNVAQKVRKPRKKSKTSK